MTDLDSPRRNNDCYFYYYSTCAKGDSCTFRHEPSALGCETMCSFWKEGKCLNIHCNYRHMELRKNRKAIQCYWETQPGGCLKPHCPFLHQNVKQSSNFGDNRIGQNTDAVQTGKSNETLQMSEKNYKSSVDPLVVNFEEESDTESAPSPIKIKKANVKTLEEIKLEKIQEESAAYFSFNDAAPPPSAYETEDDLRHRLLHKLKRKQTIAEDNLNVKKKKLNFSENKSLDEHIRTLSSKKDIKHTNVYREKLGNQVNQKKNAKGFLLRKLETGTNSIKIKTLEEIRAERLKRREMEISMCVTDSENVVTSTSKDEIVPSELNEMQPQADSISNKKFEDIEHNNMAIDESGIEYIEQCVDEPTDCSTVPQSRLKEEQVSITDEKHNESTPKNDHSNLISESFDSPMEQSVKTCETISNESDPSSNKMAEEVLLLEDDEDYVNVNFKAEDELLDEIDDILGN
ncbi:hypothetical protein WA026_020817 [Henosepilachna vigintioctopunctata]